MTDLLTGELVSVEERQAGTYLVGAHSSGVSTLNVASVAELPESGSVIVGDDTLDFTATAELTVDSVVGSSPTVTLSAPTANAYTDREPVVLTPTKAYKLALVVPNGGTVAIECLVSHAMHDRLAEGQREIGSGETVVLTKRQHGLVVTDVIGKAPAVDGGYLDPTLPITPGAVTTSWDANPGEWASRAHPEILGTGNVNGSLFVKGTIRTGGDGGGGTDLGSKGFTTYRSTGEPRSGFLNDDDQPDILRGVVDGTKGNFTEGVYLDGVNVLGQSAVLQLHSSIDPPHLEPTVFTDWPCVDVAFPDPLVEGVQPNQRSGFAVKSSTEAYCLVGVIGQGGGPGSSRGGNVTYYVAKFNPTTGSYVDMYSFSGRPATGGAPLSLSYSSLTDRLVTLETVGSGCRVRTWQMPSGSSVAFDAEWTPSGINSSSVPAMAVKNIIGTEYVVIAQSQSDGTIKIRNYIAHVQSGSTMTTPVMNMGSLAGMAHLGGTIALAGKVTWLNTDNAPALPVFDVSGFFGSVGAYLGALQVGNGDPLAAGIATWDTDTEKARTWYLSAASNSVIQHSNVFEAGAYWAQAAWGDSATGHLTEPSAAVLVQKTPGSRVTIGLGEMPTGVDSAMLYFGSGGSYPGLSGMWSQNTLVAGSAYVKVFTVQNAGPYVHPLAPGGATLTGGTPAKIVSAAGVTLMDATGYVAGGGGALGVDDDVFFAANGDIIVTARA